MSFVTIIKDYIDSLNNVYDSLSGDFTSQQLIQQTFLYLFSSIKVLIVYLISFEWLRDLTYLPILVPQISTTILKENYFLDSPLSNFFTLLETPTYDNNKFIIGFLNSFFLCLPLSTTHLISIRRLLVQGVPAGITSSIGTILGYSCFIFSVIFGLRLVIIPWLSYEPLSYLIGIFLTLTVVYDMAHERTIRKFDWSHKSKLIQIFFINFILTWTEQSCIFNYFGNLTLNAQPTILDNFSSMTGPGSFLTHSSYLVGILLGSLFFTSLFGILCLQVSNLSLRLSVLPYSRWLRYVNFSLLTLIIAFTFTSIPFYSLDYLFAGPLGFISQDKAFDKTIFIGKNLKDPHDKLSATPPNGSLATDVAPFDRGEYLLLNPEESFEDLNYQGEYAWTTRFDRQLPYKSQDSGKFISELFKIDKLNLPQKGSEIDNLSTPQGEYTAARVSSSLEQGNKLSSESTPTQENILSENIDEILDKKKLRLDDAYYSSSEDSEDLDDLENLNDFLEDDRPSDYSLKLSERIFKDLKIVELLEPQINASLSKQFSEEVPNNENPEIERRIKQRYYANPIYKLLLNADIDLFLRRQPSTHLLTPQEEKDLFEKRLLLSNYYDSLRYYQKLPYTEGFATLLNGSKSYADRVYNQQFKGTLKVVRRLFSITFNEEKDLSQKIILKFDQPLYKDLKRINNSIGHEELVLSHNKDKPFIELTNPIPFYTGWDEQLRKFVITNRILPRSTAGYNMQFGNDQEIQNYPTLTELFKQKKKVDFTMWPLPKTILEKGKGGSTIPYTVLFEQLSDPENQIIADFLQEGDIKDAGWELETVPPNLMKIDTDYRTIDIDKLQDVVPPNRGGFIWPGHSYLKMNLKDILAK